MKSDIVLDTNCLIASISRRGRYYEVWKSWKEGKYTLCVSTEILEEYEEIIARLTNKEIAENVIQTIVNSRYVKMIDPYFHFNLIEYDVDDNKFVDCAIAANAKYIITNDAHFSHLKDIPFPKIDIINLNAFLELLQNNSLL